MAANDRYGTFKNLRIIPKDPMTGKEGFALAGILLFGKDEIIATAVPSFRIALIKRVDNYDRYETID
ncbi:hypothetical protein ATZ36_08560 [Candidatus Endomicrobiellum trichonymphae]|uniref:Uncharacterized protein n=1 Tax=Endomicrobium trichonymphae TaxID=1408204 RepID=A0A1E5IGG6_ENDTX|nr:hypothetical protein ATZ36_08560 [Candidatus Endomicrobium trichonymphae]